MFPLDVNDDNPQTLRELALIQNSDRNLTLERLKTINAVLDEIKSNNKWLTRGMIATAGLTLLKMLGSVGHIPGLG